MNDTSLTVSALADLPRSHLIVAWAWILAGFISGTLLGLNFHREEWLGGYASHKRRLYRLGHISFFGLALINFIFSITTTFLASTGSLIGVASVAFLVGTITMPLCCVLVAHLVQWRNVFAVPVISLTVGAVCTFLEVI